MAFTAKYGMDISSMWPTDVFEPVTCTSGGNNVSWTGKTAYASAWNGEWSCYYSQSQENETIRGKYNKLGYQILWKSARDENAKDANGFWHEEIDGVRCSVMLHEATGIYYYLSDEYNTVDDSSAEAQTAPPIYGFSNVGCEARETEAAEYDTTKHAEAWSVAFFYTRNRYSLTFDNHGTILTLKDASPLLCVWAVGRRWKSCQSCA